MFDDDPPRTAKPKPKPLEPMSVDELRDYIAELRTEIVRAEAAIAAKEAQRKAAAALFGSG